MSKTEFENKPPEDSQAYLAAIVESSDYAIFSQNLDGTITTWNRAAEQLFGWSANEAIGKHITMIIPADRRDEEYLIIGKISAGQRIDQLETVRQTKDGTLIEVSLTSYPIRDSNGQIIGASNIARDAATLREAERASGYLAAIVESSNDAIISKNLDGYITSWNKAAERIFGYSADQAVGQHISMLFPPDLLDEEYTILGKIRAGQRVEHYRTIRRAKNGNLIHISLTVSPIRDSHGRIIGASKIARDISAEKRAEDMAREAALRKDEFLANMSHELRSPMNVVIGIADLLKRSETMSEQEREYIQVLQGSADSLLALINDLLDFSKLEAGSLQLEDIEFDLSDVIEKPVAQARVNASKKNLEIRVSYRSAVQQYLKGDPLRIQQILTNLLDNAIKFTEAGFIELIVDGKSVGKDKTLVFIEVSDTGIGIPEDKAATIFEKFRQADASTTRRYGGSGLGLSISNALATKMGGKISVRSKLGIGTTFTLEIPLENGKQVSTIEQSEPAESAARKDVLVVEDSYPNVVVVTAMLDRMGRNYDIAKNGLEAVRKFQKGRYGVVLMDIQMEGMDGFESTAQIRSFEQERKLKKTPIVAMTAHVFEKDRRRCAEAGMDDFIPKPFSPDHLEGTIDKFVPRRAGK